MWVCVSLDRDWERGRGWCRLVTPRVLAWWLQERASPKVTLKCGDPGCRQETTLSRPGQGLLPRFQRNTRRLIGGHHRLNRTYAPTQQFRASEAPSTQRQTKQRHTAPRQRRPPTTLPTGKSSSPPWTATPSTKRPLRRRSPPSSSSTRPPSSPPSRAPTPTKTSHHFPLKTPMALNPTSRRARPDSG